MGGHSLPDEPEADASDPRAPTADRARDEAYLVDGMTDRPATARAKAIAMAPDATVRQRHSAAWTRAGEAAQIAGAGR
jgi:hypothetical protein